MSFEEERNRVDNNNRSHTSSLNLVQNNRSNSNNTFNTSNSNYSSSSIHSVRYVERHRDIDRDRYERDTRDTSDNRDLRDNREPRDDRHKRYYDEVTRDRERIVAVETSPSSSHITINCKQPQNNHYENTKWSRDANDTGQMNNKMGNDQYCLRWNSYETNLLSTFEGLLDSEALSDVTLFCEGESFKAHRLVLAACSAHFSKLFSNSTLNGQLIVILEGTHHQDLQILLQFMYKGVAYLHQDRIESVLRTAEVLQVKGLSDGGVDGVNRGRPSSRPWSPPSEAIKRDRELDPPLGPRPTSPKPSGRIATASLPDSQLPPNSMPPPIFSSHYNRDPSNLQNIYQRFGINRPETTTMKPSSSTLSFGGPRGKSDLPSPGGRDMNYSKFSPQHRDREERDFESGPSRSKEFEVTKSPAGDHERDRSPHTNLQRPSSSDQFDPKPRSMTSDSTTTDKGSSPGGQRRYPDDEADRNGRHDHVKTERCTSPTDARVESRGRTFSGDFPRESLSRISQSSGGSIGPTGAQDLRTTDQHEREKQNLERFDTLRRIAEQARFAGNNMPTIQTIRDTFLQPGGFSVPLTAPLGIPASDLARIAQQVPDPAANGEPTSGTGTKLKCPFCERTYGYETNLRAHIRQRHQGIRVPCPYCHRSFTRNNTVRRHIAREHRHQINPKLIPAKFGSKQVLPDQPFQEHLNMSSEHLNNLTSQASQP